MYCSKCGEKNEEDSSYCRKCGNLLNSSNYNNDFSTSSDSQDKKLEKDGETSKTLGIISLILSFFISLLALPLAIIGLVFGIKAKKKGKTGIILNIISIILSVVLSILSFFSILFIIGIFASLWDEFENDYFELADSYHTGAYQCEMVNPTSSQFEETKNLSLRLYEDNTFSLNLYQEAKNINIDGEYELYDYKYNSDVDSYQYDLKLTSDFQLVNNQKITDNYKEYYTLEEGKKEITLTNDSNDIQYSCRLIK